MPLRTARYQNVVVDLHTPYIYPDGISSYTMALVRQPFEFTLVYNPGENNMRWMTAAIKASKRTLVLFTNVEDFDIMKVDVHIAQTEMSTRNGYECKVIPIMYNTSPAKVSEIKAENRDIFRNLAESVVFVDDSGDWCSDLANIDTGRPQMITKDLQQLFLKIIYNLQ